MDKILFENYVGIEKGRDFLIVGSGSSILEYKKKIENFISSVDPVVMGINNMNHVIFPHYHLWTNNQRFRDLGMAINKNSILMLGCGIKEELIKGRWNKNYVLINYVDKKDASLGYDKGVIKGYFRTAGCLSVFLSYLMGAYKINIAGMDGYTLYSQKELKNKEANHHCYGRGYTDDASWEKCKKKDEIVYSCLKKMNDYGISFSILTPTVFKDFQKDIL